MATIEEKAKNFASEFSSQRSLIYGFEKGAEWMLDKATAWIVKQGSKANDGVVMICVDDFIKAMEE